MSTQVTLENAAPSINQEHPYRFLGIPTRLLSSAASTGGAYGLLDHWSIPAGFASPYHLHHREDEAFYVIEGEVAFVLDGKWQRGGQGAYVFGPRGIPHGFKVVSEAPARILLLCAPGGFEQFTCDLGKPFDALATPPDMQQLIATAARYEIDILGPLPEEPKDSVSVVAGFNSGAALKNLNHQWIQAFNDRDWATERALRADNFHAFLSGSPAPLDTAAWATFMSAFTTAFPDAHISISHCIAEADTVVAHWTLTGTHRATFNGIAATGRFVQFNGIEMNRVVNGKIAEHTCQFDLASLLQNLGAAVA